ncbi:hypothetical protein V3C99_017993 [Haemonchus contortus]|uniref:DRTGG domain-containing protein n=1 Tax=Haemonchus contortus TaxID=6289 RepID=A0A7I4Z3V7_HAECO
MMCPIRLDFTLQDMAHEAGWGTGRLLDFWVTGADQTVKMHVDSVVFNADSAIIAGLLAQQKRGPIIVTAITNNAVAHFTNTMLALEQFRHIRLLRYISETAFLDETPATLVDIHGILKSLSEDFAEKLRSQERDYCT